MSISKLDKILLSKYLEEGEHVRYVIHKHLISFLAYLLLYLILFIWIPSFFAWLYPASAIYVSIWILVFIVFGVYKFFNWYLDVIILAEDSLILIEWNWFFDISSVHMEYEGVESVKYVRKGVLSSILNFGDISLEKTSWEIEFCNVVNPKKAEIEILKAKEHEPSGDESEEKFEESWWKQDKEKIKNLLKSLIEEELEKIEHSKKRWFR